MVIVHIVFCIKIEITESQIIGELEIIAAFYDEMKIKCNIKLIICL